MDCPCREPLTPRVGDYPVTKADHEWLGTNADVQLSEGRVGPRVGYDHRRCRCRGGSLSPPGYPGDLPCPTKGAAIQSHNDQDQSTLQRGTLGVREERYGEAKLH